MAAETDAAQQICVFEEQDQEVGEPPPPPQKTPSRRPRSPTHNLRKLLAGSLNTFEDYIWHSNHKQAARKRKEQEAAAAKRSRRPSPVPQTPPNAAKRRRPSPVPLSLPQPDAAPSAAPALRQPAHYQAATPALIPPHWPRSDVPAATFAGHTDDEANAADFVLKILVLPFVIILWLLLSLVDLCVAARWRRKEREAAEERADLELDGVFDNIDAEEITVPI